MQSTPTGDLANRVEEEADDYVLFTVLAFFVVILLLFSHTFYTICIIICVR